jgi:hypothetical protein
MSHFTNIPMRNSNTHLWRDSETKVPQSVAVKDIEPSDNEKQLAEVVFTAVHGNQMDVPTEVEKLYTDEEWTHLKLFIMSLPQSIRKANIVTNISVRLECVKEKEKEEKLAKLKARLQQEKTDKELAIAMEASAREQRLLEQKRELDKKREQEKIEADIKKRELDEKREREKLALELMKLELEEKLHQEKLELEEKRARIKLELDEKREKEKLEAEILKRERDERNLLLRAQKESLAQAKRELEARERKLRAEEEEFDADKRKKERYGFDVVYHHPFHPPIVVGPGPFGAGIALPFAGPVNHKVVAAAAAAFPPAHQFGLGYAGPFERLAPHVRDLRNERL